MNLSNKLVKKIPLIVLLLIFIIGFVYRIVNLGTNLPGLYNDELYFLLSAFAQLYHIGYLTVSGYNIIDFAFYTINGYIPSIILFHANPFSARFPVALYGSFMVFPIYLLANELLRNKKIALISALFWAISPSAVVTSRVGYGVQIFPLFIFLFAMYYWIKFLRSYQLKYLALSMPFIAIILIFSSIRIWALIPLFASIIYITFPRIRSKIILRKHIGINYIDYIIAFFIAIAGVWIGLLYAPIVFSHFGYSGILGVPSGFLLVSKRFPISLLDFFLRIGYALTPWKIFWFGEFSSTGLNYGSPAFVPSMMVFLLPFFYASVLGIPFFYRKNKQIMHAYYLLIGLMLFGLIQPVFNITNPYFNFEPSEGIFALPFYCMLTAFSFYLFLDWSLKLPRKNKMKKAGNNDRYFSLKKISNRRVIVVIMLVAVLFFAGVNMASFTSELFVSSNEYYQDNNTTNLNYIFYGWDHVADYLIDNHLYSETLYYTPGKGEPYYNLTTTDNFNYWFYHQNFPLYWLYTYSGGKITKIYPLYPGSLPPVPRNSSIVLSQNSSYPTLLSANGIINTVLYTVYRSDGKPAIEVIQVKDAINASEKKVIFASNLFYDTKISRFEEFNVSSLSELSSQITVSGKFSLKYGTLKPGEGYNLISSVTPTFSPGICHQNIFIHGADKVSFVPIRAIYSNLGNYSVPKTWHRLYGYTPLVHITTYLLTMTFDNHFIYLCGNDTLVGVYMINYPLYLLTTPIFYMDYNINAVIYNVEILAKAMNAGEIGYLNYNVL